MPTDATVARHRTRWQRAEAALAAVTQERDQLASVAHHAQANLDAAITERDRAQAVDPEALLVADLEAAIVAYGDRVDEARRTATQVRDTVYAEGSSYGYQRQQPQPYQPALDSALGRALLHVAQRHGVKVEATTVFPEPQGPVLAVVPPHLASALEQLVNVGGF